VEIGEPSRKKAESAVSPEAVAVAEASAGELGVLAVANERPDRGVEHVVGAGLVDGWAA